MCDAPKTKLTEIEKHAANLGAHMAARGFKESDNPYITADMRDLYEVWLRGYRWYGMLIKVAAELNEPPKPIPEFVVNLFYGRNGYVCFN